MANLQQLCIKDQCGEASKTDLITLSANQSVTIPANNRKNSQFTIPDIPEGYSFGAYRQIAVNGTGFQNVFIQSFATSGGGTKANISVYNAGDTEVTVNVSVTGLFFKVG